MRETRSFTNRPSQKTQPSAPSLRKIKLLTVRYCLPILKSTDTTSTDSLISPRPPPHPPPPLSWGKERSEERKRATLIDFSVSHGKSRSFSEEEPGRRTPWKEGYSQQTAGAEFSITPSAVTHPYHSGAYSSDDYLSRSNGKQTGKISSVYNAGDILRPARAP